jgi:hypothetical protein
MMGTKQHTWEVTVSLVIRFTAKKFKEVFNGISNK